MSLLVFLSVLSTLLSNLEVKTLQSDISLTIQAEGQVALTSPGKVVMYGERFVGSARGYEVAYDGRTFYLYDPDTEEITLSQPTREELLTTNPLLYAKALAEVSTLSESVNRDSTITTITLIPKGTPNEQMKVIVKVKGEFPISVEIKEPQSNTTLKLKNPQFITSTPEFTISKPNAYINDLR